MGVIPPREGGWLPSLLVVLSGSAGLVWFAFALRPSGGPGGAPDIHRQWVVSRYVLAGHDPYALARDVLHDTLGPPARARTLIREIPQEVPDALRPRLLPGLGPPEATYPPPAVALFSLTVGLLPANGVLLPAWAVVNGLALIAVIVQLSRLYPPRPGLPTYAAVCFVAWAALLYNPYFRAVQGYQFVLPVLAALLHATRPGTGVLSGGLALALALIKPSVALPFVVLVVNQRRWGLLATAAALQMTGWLGLAVWLGRPPLALLRDWLTVGPYFMASSFGIQPLIIHLYWVGKPQGTLLTLLALLVVLALGWVARRAAHPRQLAFVGLGSLLWTYHLGYDFVCLLPALLLLVGRPDDRTGLLSWRTIGAFAWMLALGLASFVPERLPPPAVAVLTTGVQAGLFAWYVAMAWGIVTGGGRAGEKAYPPAP